MANIQENICALCHALIDIDIVMDHELYSRIVFMKFACETQCFSNRKSHTKIIRADSRIGPHECYDGYTKIHVDDAGYVYSLDNGMIVDPNEINNQSLTKIL